MLNMRYVHLTKAKPIHDTLSSERILHKEYDRKVSVSRKQPSGHESRVAWHHTN
jgi:hypothetical protein